MNTVSLSLNIKWHIRPGIFNLLLPSIRRLERKPGKYAPLLLRRPWYILRTGPDDHVEQLGAREAVQEPEPRLRRGVPLPVQVHLGARERPERGGEVVGGALRGAVVVVLVVVLFQDGLHWKELALFGVDAREGNYVC